MGVFVTRHIYIEFHFGLCFINLEKLKKNFFCPFFFVVLKDRGKYIYGYIIIIYKKDVSLYRSKNE